MNLRARARTLARASRRGLLTIQAWADVHLSRKSLRVRIRRVWRGGDPCAAARRAALFCHFDNKGNIASYVVHHVQELAAAGFRIYFVSNAQKLRESEVEKVLPHVCEVIWRKNIGFDFGAYKDGVARLAARGLAELDGLLLVNDSIYGPLFPLREIFERGEALDVDFWGITDNWERRWHLQSYFLYFNQSALSSEHFLNFFLREIPYFHTQEGLIQYGEVMLSTFFSSTGLRSRALFEYNKIVARLLKGTKSKRNQSYRLRRVFDSSYNFQKYLINRAASGKPMNPTHYFWDLLLSERCPFIKRDLLIQNPSRIPTIFLWQNQIAQHSDYDTELILDHLKLAAQPQRWA